MTFLTNIFTLAWQRREYLYELLIQHIVLSLVAIIIITIIGISAGIFVLNRKGARKIIIAAVNFLYTIPSIAMFGIFIPLMGIGFTNALIVLVIYGLLPMIHNTYTGLKEVDPLLLDAARGMGATKRQIFFRVRWPLAFPTILSGFRTMVVMTIALAGLASFIGAGGLGQAIYRGINTNNSSLIIVGSLAVALLALVFDFVIGMAEKAVVKGRRSAAKNRKNTAYLAVLFLIIAAMMIPFFNQEERGENELIVASKPTAEQYILGEIISELIESNTDVFVKRKFGIGGGSSHIHPAMLKGEADIYPEYTGTAWLFILDRQPPEDPDSAFLKLKNIYEEKYNLIWTGRLGFNNTFTLAMPEDLAERMNVKTFSDLAQKSDQLRFGAEFDFFERPDGFPGLDSVYGFNFRKVSELDINLKFDALDNDMVDVINAFSTDSRVKAMNLRVLEDDKNFFPAYHAGIIAGSGLLNEYPEMGGLLEELNGLINDSVMTALNYEVEIENHSPARVAWDFLERNKLRGGK